MVRASFSSPTSGDTVIGLTPALRRIGDRRRRPGCGCVGGRRHPEERAPPRHRGPTVPSARACHQKRMAGDEYAAMVRA